MMQLPEVVLPGVVANLGHGIAANETERDLLDALKAAICLRCSLSATVNS